MEFTATRDESTRCNFCKNKCLRTYIDTKTPQGDARRFIIATCEKGSVEKMEDMKVIKARLDEIKKANPNFVEKASVEAFRSFGAPKVSTLREADDETEAEAPQSKGIRSLFQRRKPAPVAAVPPRISEEVREMRASIKIGIPRVLNMYSTTPFFSAYLEAVGVHFRNIVYSDYTDPQMWFRGSRRGSIDQCFPSKVSIAHIHNLIFDKKEKDKPDVIFFPIIQKLRSELANTVDSAACPTVSISPEVVKAAFTREGDVFAENGIHYMCPSFDMKDWKLFQLQMYQTFR